MPMACSAVRALRVVGQLEQDLAEPRTGRGGSRGEATTGMAPKSGDRWMTRHLASQRGFSVHQAREDDAVHGGPVTSPWTTAATERSWLRV